jgi:deazaflavin-dependent oxidoreductase (nitroreductase family)
MTQLSGTYVPSTLEWVRNQIDTYERTRGTEGNTLLETGIPVIIVTMRGAKSGNVRKIALMRVEHEGSYALVASKGGAPDNPDWYYNLLSHPTEVLVQDGPEPFPVTVRQVEGAERTQWWARSVAVFPTYDEYQSKTKRQIPVLIAEPVS